MMRIWLSSLGKSKRLMAWPGLAAVLLLALLHFVNVPIISPALDQVGLLVFDSYQRAAPRPYEDAGVRVVDIDDETIKRYGQWPWPRTDVARLTDALGQAGAAAIAYDIVFSEPDRTSPPRLAASLDQGAARTALARLPDNDVVLGESFAKNPVVAGYFLTRDASKIAVTSKAGMAVAGSTPGNFVQSYSSAIQPLPPLLKGASGNGFVSLSGEGDSIIRSAPLIARQGDQLLPSLALDALRTAQQAGSIVVKTSDASGELGGSGDVVSVKVGDYEVPTTAGGELWMHYTQRVPERTIPAWKILSGALSPQDMADAFGGRIVFVGAGAIGLRDLISTPLQDRDPGVLVHAQATEQMILGQFLTRPDWATGVENALLLILGISLALALPTLGATRGAIIGAGLVGGIVGGSWYAFKAQHLLLDPTYPVLGLTAAYVLVTGLTYYREEKQRAYIHNAFDRYLSPDLVKRIADDPGQLELGGEERPMTVLFCDIRSFSSISEKMGPKEIIGFLIRFLTPMTDLLLTRKATIDKYIGDAILAFWNAPLDDPDQYRNAARGALEMSARLKTLNAEMQAQTAEPWPGTVKIGIGLNAGHCCVGNMGSQQRLSYSLIGDTVNLASRIEGLTKYYGVEIAIGSALQAELPGFATLPIDMVRVVGRATPETVHVLLGDEALAADPAFQAFAKRHDAMLTAFRAQDWEMAGELIDALDEAADAYGLTKLYGLYRDRILIFAATPPGAEWDGVFVATEK
jgi:adenylate cyclase